MFSPIGQIPLPDCHLILYSFRMLFQEYTCQKTHNRNILYFIQQSTGNLTIFLSNSRQGHPASGYIKDIHALLYPKTQELQSFYGKNPRIGETHPFPPILKNGTGAPQDPGPESVTCGRQRLISGKLTPCNRERMHNSLQQNVRLCVALCSL